MIKKYKVKYYLQGEVEVNASTKQKAQKQIQENYKEYLTANSRGILVGVPKEVKNAKE